MRPHHWKLAIAGVAVCLAVFGLIRWRQSQSYTASQLVALLPDAPATLIYVDAKALREGGILELLAGSKAAEEPDYRKFVEQTGFDYRRDLDAVAASFSADAKYFVLRGRFQWNRLVTYARAGGGQCRDNVCSMAGSTADRNISFHPLGGSLLALAVSKDAWSVQKIGASGTKDPHVLPPDPVWISVPPSALAQADAFPAGTQTFLAPLAQAQKVTFAAGAEGNHFRIRLEITSASRESAAELVTRFTAATDLLKKMIDREHQTPNPSDLSGVLVAGSFAQKDNQVVCTWPLERSFVQNLAAGGLP